jgi:hypothetical protein
MAVYTKYDLLDNESKYRLYINNKSISILKFMNLMVVHEEGEHLKSPFLLILQMKGLI